MKVFKDVGNAMGYAICGPYAHEKLPNFAAWDYEGSRLPVLCDLDTFPGLMVFLSTFCPFETSDRGDMREKEGAGGVQDPPAGVGSADADAG